MIAELRDDHVREQTRASEASLDGTRGGRCLDHAVAASAGELRLHMPNDPEALRNVLELFGDVFAELTQLAAGVRTAVAARSVGSYFTQEVLRKRLALRFCLRLWNRRYPFDGRLHLSLRGLHVFELKLKQLKLNDDLLALPAEDHVPQLLDHELQVFDPLAARSQLIGLLR